MESETHLQQRNKENFHFAPAKHKTTIQQSHLAIASWSEKRVLLTVGEYKKLHFFRNGLSLYKPHYRAVRSICERRKRISEVQESFNDDGLMCGEVATLSRRRLSRERLFDSFSPQKSVSTKLHFEENTPYSLKNNKETSKVTEYLQLNS